MAQILLLRQGSHARVSLVPILCKNPLYQPVSDLKEEVHASLLYLLPLLKKKGGVK